MNTSENIPAALSDSLQTRIQARIDRLKMLDMEIPAIVIVHNIQEDAVIYMSEKGLNTLGVTLNELINMGPDYHSRFFNPEDAKDYVPRIFDMLKRNNDDEMISFFQQVRRSPDHEWQWYLSGTKIFMRDDAGAVLLLVTYATPVDTTHHLTLKVQRLQEQNNFLRNNHRAFDSLTKREKEVLKMMAMGLSSGKMAKKLFISETTAATHRKNIKKKLKIQSTYDVTNFAQAFDLL